MSTRKVLRLSEQEFYNLIRESVCEVLNESKVSNKSYPLGKILPIIARNGGKWLNDEYIDKDNVNSLTFFMLMEDVNSTKFDRIKDALNVGGYSITSIGGYYDDRRLRTDIEDAVKARLFNNGNPYNICTVMIEPLYNKEVDDDYIKGEMEDSDYDYPQLYKEGIFYHATLRKYLPRIRKHGLVPKNGNTITRSRKTNDRVYLSTVPDFSAEYFMPSNEEEEDGDDMILLKVDLSRLNRPIKLYQDNKYENAVYATENIPPYCIVEEINGDYLDLYRQLGYWYSQILKNNSKRFGCNEKELAERFKKESFLRKQAKNILIKNTHANSLDERYFGKAKVNQIIDTVIDNYL